VRPIFVGDVQGCAEEFEELLERAAEAFGEDFELWVVGDLVNRGPYNLRALRSVRELVDAGRARYVLGNHEMALLCTALGLRARDDSDSFDDVLDAPEAAQWVEWLRRRPLVETGRVGGQRVAMVHAAIHPDWCFDELRARARAVESRLAADALEDARRFLAGEGDADGERDVLERLTNCRSVAPGGRWSPEIPAGEWIAWHAAWSARGHDYGVVYGHWALQGLHVAPGLRGLDTGCVHHGRGHDGVLTAWVPDEAARAPFDVPDGKFWRVRARRAYCEHRDGDS
jgi:bis(5'-nucleosyl)-tetraphosphatase (symmetrical)